VRMHSYRCTPSDTHDSARGNTLIATMIIVTLCARGVHVHQAAMMMHHTQGAV
jgi:hypothetical protein